MLSFHDLKTDLVSLVTITTKSWKVDTVAETFQDRDNYQVVSVFLSTVFTVHLCSDKHILILKSSIEIETNI